ncbi:MAG: mycothiol system anti-sigma-R factor [Acidimicrobiales bacterium]|jgi:mycothiol system anti-sigma-R factor
MKRKKDDGEVDCEETLSSVYHFLDGALTAERRDQIAHHLDECPDCFDAFGFEVELRKLVADRCRDEVPDELRQRIAAAIAQEHNLRANVGGETKSVQP